MEELIQKAIKGDESAFSTLVLRYQHQIYHIAYRFFGHQQDAEDATQNTIIKIYRSLQTYRKGSSFKNWVYTITMNTCRDMMRKAKRTPSFSYDNEENMAVLQIKTHDREDNPEDFLMGKEEMAQLERAIRELPEEYRSVIILREFSILSYEEIIEVLGISLGTVKSRIIRARKMLREKLIQSGNNRYRGSVKQVKEG